MKPNNLPASSQDHMDASDWLLKNATVKELTLESKTENLNPT